MKPRLLDLFCGAGGAAVGYARAGFEVVGVDIESQPNYPFEFHQEDALAVATKVSEGWTDGSGDEWWLAGDRYSGLRFDAIHASPPCQAFTAAQSIWGREHPDLLTPCRKLLIETGLPYVIENVPGAPMEPSLILCGTAFPELRVRRHRWFEMNWAISPLVYSCDHTRRTVPVFGHGGHIYHGVDDWKRAMGIDWMTRDELAQAIPPAFTEYIGHYLMAHLEAQEIAA